MKNLTKAILTIIVMVIMVVGVMIPINAGLDPNVKTIEQNSPHRFILKENQLNLTVECPELGKYIVNGEAVDGMTGMLIIGEGIYIYMYTDSWQILDLENNIFQSGTSTGDIISIKNGVFNYTVGETSYTGTTHSLLYPSSKGNYGAFSNAPFSVDVGETVYIISSKGVPEPKFAYEVVDGVVNTDQPLVAPSISAPFGPYTGTVTPTVTASLSEDGLSYEYTTLSVTTDTSTFVPVIYAPLDYHIIDSSSDSVKQIIDVLPILILIALVILVGSLIYSRFKGDNQL